MFSCSIRFRLTMWYAGSLAVIMAASGLFWHFYLNRNLLSHFDDRLLLFARDISAFHLERGHDGDLEQECLELENFSRRHNWGQFVQFLDRSGSIVCTTSNLGEDRLPLSKPALTAVSRGGFHFETIRNFKGKTDRLLTFAVTEDGQLTDIIQIAENLSQFEETMGELQFVLWTFSPLVLAALAVGSWFVVGQALLPVVQISRTMKKITAENLGERLPVDSSSEEIINLSTTFNSMLARLEDSFRRIRQFTGDASHELRTPLTILKGETEVALRWAKEPEEFRQMLQSNMEEIDRMGRILENLLILAKSEAGEIHLDIQKISLSDLLQDLYLQAKALGEAKQISVFLNPQVAEEIHIHGDEIRLRQMFLNLITNGIKYTQEGGRVELILQLEGEYALVTVADSGIGIPSEHLPHIFDRFYRIDKARNREDGGSGLGLAIVQWIIEEHQGKISVRSTPGVGSAFAVRLPLAGPDLSK